MAAPVYIVQGPQGSGKGTQAKLLARHLGGVTFSSGELWRASAHKELSAITSSGKLAPTDFILKLVGDHLATIPADTTVVIDGFPRMLPEGLWLLDELQKLQRPLRRVILLAVPREESVQRLLKRAASESDRPDDKLEDINNRLDLYEAETSQVLALWREKGLLAEVDGVGTVEEIAERINKVVDEA